MQFVRWGTRGAQPRFQVKDRGMIDAKHLLKFEVGEHDVTGVEAAKRNASVYRMDVRGIDHPDARLIAAAPEILEALEHAVDIAEGRQLGEWDDLLPYRALIRKVTGEAA